MFSPELLRDAEIMLQGLRARNMTLTTVESCTGGLLSGLLTEIPGSSDIFHYGFITYADAAKRALVQVPEALLTTYGAVSQEVAQAMAQGALLEAKADLSIAITGIAGPGGARPGKPVGLVHIASARAGFSPLHAAQQFYGDRAAVRMQAIRSAIDMLMQQLSR